MKLLQIICSPRKESIGAKVANQFLKRYEGADVETINVFDLGLVPFSKGYMGDYYSPTKVKTESDIYQEQLRDGLLQKFIEADILVISTPTYNFSYPVELKMFIDSIFIIGKTFDTSIEGPNKGLLEPNKRIDVIVTHGNPGEEENPGFTRSIIQAFEYIGLANNLGIADLFNIFAKSVEELVVEADRKLYPVKQ